MSATFEELCAVAYKTERVLGRRLAKNLQLSEEDALRQVLVKAANNSVLDNLISGRRRSISSAAEKVTARKQQQADAYARKQASRQPDPSAWLAWFDGSTKPNPGKMGIGALLKSPDGRIVEISLAAGHGDSNQAEYLALIAVLEEAVRIQPDNLVVYGDSQIVIGAMNCAADGSPGLKKYGEQAKRLMSQLKSVTLTWIPRHRNSAADALSQQALHQT